MKCDTFASGYRSRPVIVSRLRRLSADALPAAGHRQAQEGLNGYTWKTFHEGTTLGDFSKSFKDIRAQEVRLNILEASNVPTLWEFQLLEEKKK